MVVWYFAVEARVIDRRPVKRFCFNDSILTPHTQAFAALAAATTTDVPNPPNGGDQSTSEECQQRGNNCDDKMQVSSGLFFWTFWKNSRPKKLKLKQKSLKTQFSGKFFFSSCRPFFQKIFLEMMNQKY